MHLPDLRIGAEHLLHRREGCAAAGHIVPRLPVIHMQGDIGHQVNGRLEDIECFTAACEVKAVPCVAALRGLAKAFSLTGCTPQVRVSGRAILIHADKYAVIPPLSGTSHSGRPSSRTRSLSTCVLSVRKPSLVRTTSASLRYRFFSSALIFI